MPSKVAAPAFLSSAPLRRQLHVVPTPVTRPRLTSALQVATPTRRQILPLLPLLFLSPLPARADRTGKYSTKLTAKRRYLPRIKRGILSISNLSPGFDVSNFDVAEQNDLLSALRLFASAYFSEGNRIGAREKFLLQSVAQLSDALASLREAGEREGRETAFADIVKCVNDYVDEAGLTLLADVQRIEI